MTTVPSGPDYLTIGTWRDLLRHRWEGSPIPPPHAIKLYWLDRFRRRYGISTLIETGTYFGFTIDALKERFAQLYSIELDAALYAGALQKFSAYSHIHLLQGDSATLLEGVLRERTERCLLWLDGHYSGPGTARGDEDSPISKELTAISQHSRNDHVIIVDDARYFDGLNGYLTIDAVKRQLHAINPHYRISVVDDSIRAVPPGGWFCL